MFDPDSGAWRLLSDDPRRGVRKYTLQLDDRQTVVRTEYYRTEELLEQNAAERSVSAPLKHSGKAWIRKVATLPPNVFGEYLFHAIKEDDTKAVRKVLNDPDYRAFRTCDGKV